MSIKIYNGLKIRANSIDEAVANIKQDRKSIIEKNQEIYMRKEFYTSVSIMTDYLIKSENILKTYFNIETSNKKLDIDENKSAMSHAFFHYLDQKDENKINTQLVLYPEKIRINNQNYYLAQIFAEKELQIHILNLYKKSISEYAYSNNSDHPENISKEDWNERGKNWEKILTSKSGIPAFEGLTFQFVPTGNPNSHISDEQRMDNLYQMCLESKEKPYKHYAANDKIIDIMGQIILTKEDNSLTPQSVYKVIDKIRNKKFNKQEQLDWDKLKKIFDDILPKELTPDIMRKNLLDLKYHLNSLKINFKLDTNLTDKKIIKNI